MRYRFPAVLTLTQAAARLVCAWTLHVRIMMISGHRSACTMMARGAIVLPRTAVHVIGVYSSQVQLETVLAMNAALALGLPQQLLRLVAMSFTQPLVRGQTGSDAPVRFGLVIPSIPWNRACRLLSKARILPVFALTKLKRCLGVE